MLESDSTRHASDFVHRLLSLADRLAEKDIVVASLHCDWGAFGSWMLEVQNGLAADAYAKALHAERWDTPGPHVLRAVWDGRDRILVIESAPTPPLSAPRSWTTKLERTFEDIDAAVLFVEDQIVQWTSTAASDRG